MSNSLEPYNFFFELPLYAKIKISEENHEAFISLTHFSDNIDAYSPALKENTTYKCVENPNTYSQYSEFHAYTRPSSFVLVCKRSDEKLVFFVHWNKEQSEFQKIGQYPSIATLHISKVKAYDRILGKEQLREFTRAIGLAANGVGIGSFIYLRRIFEMLINDAFQKATTEGIIRAENYNKLRMADRIGLLKDYLPSFLSENKELYSILSLGLHSLDENTCLQHFEVVKVGIELILDEKVEEYNKQQKMKDAAKRIEALKNSIDKKQP